MSETPSCTSVEIITLAAESGLQVDMRLNLSATAVQSHCGCHHRRAGRRRPGTHAGAGSGLRAMRRQAGAAKPGGQRREPGGDV